jgi:hypothetical protein
LLAIRITRLFTEKIDEAVLKVQFLKIVGIRVRPSDSLIVAQANTASASSSQAIIRQRIRRLTNIEWLASLGSQTIGVERQKASDKTSNRTSNTKISHRPNWLTSHQKIEGKV